MQASRPRNTHTTAAIKLPCITLTVNFRPSQTALRFCKPTGYPEACHGVARQGEDGRTHLVRQVRQVRQVRHKCHAPATRIPPLPSNRQAYPTGTFSPEPYQTAVGKPKGYIVTPHSPLINLIILIILMQASRPRNTHTAAANKAKKGCPVYPDNPVKLFAGSVYLSTR